MFLKMQTIFKTHTALLGILVIAALVFRASLFNGFTDWDDTALFLEHPLSQALTPNLAMTIFSDYSRNYCMPLYFFTFSIQRFFWGELPFGTHLVSLLAHLMNTTLIFIIFQEVTQKRNIALLTALVFSIHPVQVETVAWIAEQKGAIGSVYFLLSIVMFIRFCKAPLKKYYWMSFVFFLMAVLSKPSMLILPLLLLFLHTHFGEKSFLKTLRSLVPFLVLALGWAIFGSLMHTKTIGPQWIVPWDIVLKICDAFIFYVHKIWVPFPLSCAYWFEQAPGTLFFNNQAITFSAALCILIVMFYTGKRIKNTRFGFIWFLLCLLPYTTQALFKNMVSDRYLYVAIAGFVCAWAAWVVEQIERLDRRQRFQKNALVVLAALSCVAVVWMMTVSMEYVGVWKNNKVLWDNVLLHEKRLPDPFINQANQYLSDGDYANAKASFLKAAQLMPNDPDIWLNLGTISLAQGDKEAAKNTFLKALSLNPNHALSYNNLGVWYYETGDYKQAQFYFKKALSFNPNQLEAIMAMGHMYLLSGRLDAAQRYLEFAANKNKKDYVLWGDLGYLYATLGKTAAAEKALLKSLQLNPNHAEAWRNLGSLYGNLGLSEKSAYAFAQAHGKEVLK